MGIGQPSSYSRDYLKAKKQPDGVDIEPYTVDF